MKRRPFIIIFVFVLLLLSGCSVALPVATPAPVQLATAQPVTETALPPAATLAVQAAASATAPPQPDPSPTVTPVPLPDTPTMTETLAAGLSYVQAGFKLKMPAADSFAPTQPPDLSSVEIEQALASGPWLAAIGPVGLDENDHSYRVIILSNESGRETMRWWGQVDEHGTASTTVFTGMPRPKSTKVKGIIGKIALLPEGSAYERYFENAKGQRFGIISNKEAISALLANMTEADGRIQVWGELRYAVDDYNGRRILVRNYDLKDVQPEVILARSQTSQADQPAPSSEAGEADLGPSAIVRQPQSRAVIHGQTQVAGEVDNLTGAEVIVRAEDADGQTLGEIAVAPEPPQDGRAQFTAVLPFADPPSLSEGRIAIYAPDPTGQPLLLGWQEVRFAGPVGDMGVTILQPGSGTAIRGAVLVKGQAQNIPSGSLLVRVEDTAGVVMGKAKASIGTADNWGAKVSFRRPKTARAGVIAVYDVNSADGSLTLLALTPVKLKK